MTDSNPKPLIDRLYDRIKSGGLDSLNPEERAAFGMTWLFLETNNGGLSQFFFNDAGKLAGTLCAVWIWWVPAKPPASSGAQWRYFPTVSFPLHRRNAVTFSAM